MPQQVSCEQISGWFINSTQKGQLDEHFWQVAGIQDPGGDASMQTMLRQLKGNFPSEVRDLLPDAVAKAISSWNKKEHGVVALTNLAWFAGELRAGQAVGDLQRHTDNDLLPLYRHPKTINALGATVMVVASFAPEVPLAKQAVEKWLDEPRLAEFTGSLVNTLCECSPHDYPKYLPRFFKAADDHPSYFETDAVVVEMVRRVTFPVVALELYRLSETDLPRFLQAIAAAPVSRAAKLTINPPTIYSFRDKQGYTCAAPTAGDRDKLEKAFQPLVAA